jgi:hypothetical protein
MSVPSKVPNVRVFNPLDGLTATIQWDIVINLSAVLGYNVYRGLTVNFADASRVNVAPLTITQFQDVLPQGQVIRQQYYYFVTAFNADGESLPSDPAAYDPFTSFSAPTWNQQAYILKEFIRRKFIIMGRTGEQVKYFIRKVAGSRCSCWDPIRNSVTDPNCTLCFGTTYQGGYVRIDTTMRVLGSQEQRSRKELGIEITNQPAGWTIVYPIMAPQDILVRKNNLRYRITTVTPTINSGVLTEQGFTMKELEPRTIEFLLD